MKPSVNNVLKDLGRIVVWMQKNNWAGYDPYDVKGLPFFRWLERNKRFLGVSQVELAAEIAMNLFPVTIRKLLNIRPQENAKAMALIARGSLKIYKVTNLIQYLSLADMSLNWLIRHNHANSERQLGWGYPFDWQSVVFIPRETPLIVVSSLGGHALLDRFELSKNNRWLFYAQKVKNFLLEALNQTEYEDGSISLSYSCIDNFRVINSNMYGASFLARYGILAKDEEAIQFSRKIRRFVLNHQREDGAWEYWADKASIVDAYHLGITLEWLDLAIKYDAPLKGELEALDKGLKYFISKFVRPDGMCPFKDNSLYPIDIHAVAQCIVTLSQLLPCEEINIVRRIVEFANSRMKNKDGTFIYRILKFGLKSRIPFIRWGQAWMFWALANYLERIKKCVDL